MFTLGHNKFLIEINYKSGIQKRFWCYSFSKNRNGTTHWAASQHRPVEMWTGEDADGVIESIWQLSARRGLLGIKE